MAESMNMSVREQKKPQRQRNNQESRSTDCQKLTVEKATSLDGTSISPTTRQFETELESRPARGTENSRAVSSTSNKSNGWAEQKAKNLKEAPVNGVKLEQRA